MVCLILLLLSTARAEACFELDSNGTVDFADFVLFAEAFGSRYELVDFLEFQKQFGKPADCSKPELYTIEYPTPDEYTAHYPTPRINAVEVSPSSVRLSWMLDNTERVIGYWVNRSPHPISRAFAEKMFMSNHIDETSPDSTAFTVGPLLAETKYTLKVSAVYGTRGLPQLSGNAVVKTTTLAFAAPGPPMLVLLGWENRESALITWSRHPSINAYTLLKDGESIVPWLNPSLRTVFVGSLRPFTRYEITGKARDIWGKVYTGKPLVLCLNCE